MSDTKISWGTIIRTAAVAGTIANIVLTRLGYNPLPFSEGEIYSWGSDIAGIAATLCAWWKNNSFTKAARKGDRLMKELKNGAYTETD